jgi:hypothetical protein
VQVASEQEAVSRYQDHLDATTLDQADFHRVLAPLKIPSIEHLGLRERCKEADLDMQLFYLIRLEENLGGFVYVLSP